MPSMHSTIIVPITRGMETLSAILDKAESHMGADLADLKLADDMKPLSFQIQTCANVAKKTVARLTGVDDTPVEDNEKTLAELRERIQTTVAMLNKVSPADVEGSESKQVELKLGPVDPVKMTGEEYIFDYALPNFYFHLNMTYAILRSKGVPLGKGDYLAIPMGKHFAAAKKA